MEKRKIVECLDAIKHDVRIAKDKLGHAEYLAHDMSQRLQDEDYIDDPRFEQVLGVFESLLIELKQMKKKRGDDSERE